METQFFGDNFGAKIAFADEQWHNEDVRRRQLGQHGFDVRFLFPECLPHFEENPPATQLCRVLGGGQGGAGIQFRSMTQHDQRGIGKIFTLHAMILPEARKPASQLISRS